jgi:uncharacterized protein
MTNVFPFEVKHNDKMIQLGKTLHLDLSKLIETRMLIQANSGGGKSSLMRLIVERAAGKMPFIILDWEGEFITLREVADVVLVGSDGEIATDTRSAKLLARKLIELHASAVIDLSDLEPSKRREYVKGFLESLINLPRNLWHSTIVCVDEAHQLCPEAGKAESAQAVINLMSLGRKRGLCGILATQRLSKLHKDAASECNNIFIGRTNLDNDQIRAGDVLGMSKADRLTLRDLEPGEFHAFGPALSAKGVVRFQSLPPTTEPPKAGERHSLTIPKASDVVSHIVSQLGDLPQQAQEEAKTLEQAQKRIRDLERQIKTGATSATLQIDFERERRLREETETRARQLYDKVSFLQTENTHFRALLIDIHRKSSGIEAVIPEMEKPVAPPVIERKRQAFDAGFSRPISEPRKQPTTSISNSRLPEGERKILTAIAQYPEGATREQLSILTGYKRSSRDAYIQRLRTSGYVSIFGQSLFATEEGVEALGDFEPLPTGDELRAYWLGRLPEGERRVLEVLISVYPDSTPRESIDTNTGYKRSSRDAYLQRLSARRLVDSVGRGEVKANSILFD